MDCPVCKNAMELRDLSQRRLYHRCFDHGVFVSLSFFKWFKGAGPIAQKLLQARRQPVAGKDKPLSCPQCRVPMVITLNEINGSFEVDQCLKCNSAWFDVGEMAKLKNRGELEGEFPNADLNQRTSRPVPEVPELLKVGGREDFHPLMMLGLPVEEDHHGTALFPVGTWLLIAFCVGISFLAIRNQDFMMKYLFYPSRPFAHFGLNFVFSSLMHGGWVHLISNMYFLMVVGDNIEAKEGPGKLFWLFWVGCLAGKILTMKMGITRPSLGASAGISALVVYYVLMFPQNRFRMGFFRGIRFGGGLVVFSVSATGYLLWWAGTQAVGAVLQLQGFGNVGYIAHAGGALTGFIAYFVRAKD